MPMLLAAKKEEEEKSLFSYPQPDKILPLHWRDARRCGKSHTVVEAHEMNHRLEVLELNAIDLGRPSLFLRLSSSLMISQS